MHPAGKSESDGLHALRAHAKYIIQAEMARAIGVDRRTVAAWLAGRKRPSGDARKAIERLYSISLASWDVLSVHNRAPAPASPVVPEPVAPITHAPIASNAVDSPADESDQDDLPKVGDLLDIEISDPAVPGGSLSRIWHMRLSPGSNRTRPRSPSTRTQNLRSQRA